MVCTDVGSTRVKVSDHRERSLYPLLSALVPKGAIDHVAHQGGHGNVLLGGLLSQHLELLLGYLDLRP